VRNVTWIGHPGAHWAKIWSTNPVEREAGEKPASPQAVKDRFVRRADRTPETTASAARLTH
jgi:hypothetical protein